MAAASDDHNLRSAFDELKAVNHVLERISHVQETNHIMSIIIDELVKLCRADQGVISLASRRAGDDLVTVVRHDQEASDGLPYKVSNQISGWVLANEKQAVIDDLDNDARFRDLSSEEGRFQSVICSPMMVRGEVIGIISLTRTKTLGPFGADEARLAGILANQSAPLLQNAKLLEELAGKNRLLEQSQRQLRDENARLKSEVSSAFAFENIIGKSEPMRHVLKMASKVSSNDSPVLITGPTGTGKELIARAIHYHSPRRDKPFVVKNCGVKTESLLEAELFGHVKGAFTGATTDKPGLFREADGGTIFLDEVGEAPLSTQVAILRALETGEVRPVGSSQVEHVDVRVISATNRDLEESISAGEFRQDLYFRLNTFTIEMPPLKQRASDIPLLVKHTLGTLKAKMGLDDLRITPEAMDLLRRFDWPGNVRQLENELERAAVVSDAEGLIDAKDLSNHVKGIGVDKATISAYRGKLRDIVDKVEREVIAATLTENDGNISRTAEILGLTRKGLKDKKTRYKID